MKLRPLGKNVLIIPAPVRKETASGIILPHGEKSGGALLGLVVGAAEGVELKDGDRVYYAKNAPAADAGEGRILVAYDDVLAVLERE